MVIKSSEKNLHSWNSALYLTERKIDPSIMEKDGENHVLQWCSRTGLTPELLHFRLKEDGLDYHLFQKILCGSSQPFDYKEKDWFRTLEDIFSVENLLTEENVERIDRSQSPFYPFMVPFMSWAKRQMLDQFRIWKERQSNLPFKISNIISVLMKAVHQYVHSMSGRMLVYELNVARLNEQLKGGTPEARFEYFVRENLIEKQHIYQLLQKYPALARLLSEGTRNLVDSILESVSRFLDDYHAIVQTFKGNFLELIDIDTMEGDRHNRGRCVMIYHFASGKRLVYKPRTLSMDVHFQEFLCWMNDRGACPKFKTLNILSRPEYGWEEWVEHKECEHEDQIIRFYQRMGGYLAVLYLLYATDFHLENVLANGEHPFLIDVEALFQNVIPLEGNEESAFQNAAQILNQSILRSGMLPVSLFKSGEFRGLEVSAIGGRAGQELPRMVYRYENIRTDQMKLVKTKGFLKGGRNRPRLNKDEVKTEAYVEEIVNGFRQVYKLLTDNREELMTEEGPLGAFADDSVRAVFRNTYNYATMLEASLHPNYLKDGLSRVQLFDFLWRAVEHQPSIVRLVSSETADLLRGDIPMFTNKVNSRDLWDVRGKRIQGFYPKSALDLVFERLQGLSLEDCEKQIYFIRMSMSTITEKNKTSTKNSLKMAPKLSNHLASQNQFIEASVKIGDLLLNEAVWGKDGRDVCWIGLSTDESEQLTFTPMNDSLYDGVLGMALYFAYLSRESGEQRFNKAAHAALQGAFSIWESGMTVPSVSAFNGWASGAYVLSHLAVLWKEQELMDEAIRLLGKTEQLIDKDTLYDLIAGSAGVILVALRIYSLTGNKECLNLAVKAGNHLLAKARKMNKGIGWAFEKEGCVPIGGLAHGAAGFSWAQMELSKISGDEKFLEAALQALTFERTLFDEGAGNWKDVQPEGIRYSTGTSAVKWCHGAPGIAMGRIMSFRLYPDDHIRKEIEIALNTTLHHGFGVSHCLCHGDLGNLDAMLLAGEVLEQEAWKKTALACGTRVLKEAEKSGWICGIPHGLATPGLMTGMAGIGYGLLRLANSKAVPSILTLGGPIPEGKGENSIE
ncbi:type 2 lanthipeptide synthetase LanM family protein [Bacillus sp. 03113]|uniref:type 2 lanthipeptide synthetase LanM family protein n=1 Tax=Bacillus sp. 03113 TaxID=2578211 RepID=UPI001143F1A4|nr:type 2 lanthipeptide synthetase LanM family protein [Bacillus sp. 03113]